MANLTDEIIINAAIEGFEAQKGRIDQHIAQLRQSLNGGPVESVAVESAGAAGFDGRRKVSKEGRARMAAAQRARWAAKKGGAAAPAPTSAAPKKKRKLSAEGRRKIIEATRRRWALINAGK